MLKKIAITLIFIVHTVFSFAQNSLDNQQTLVIAYCQYGDNSGVQNIQPFATHFSAVTDLRTEVKNYPSLQNLVLAMKNGEVDIAFISTFGYLMLREKTFAYEISAAWHLPEKEASRYKSILAINKKNKIQSLEVAVKNAGNFMLTFVEPGSTLGDLLPRLKLSSMMDVEPEMVFVEVQYAGQHNLASQAALNDEYMLAAFGREEFYKLGADTVNLTRLWESPSIPLGPVVCKKSLSESTKESLQKILLELHQQNPAALESVKTGWTEVIPADRFMLTDDSYYDNLINIFGNRARSIKLIGKYGR